MNDFDPNHFQRYHRRSVRLKGRDYSASGAYFVTLCCYQKKCWLGEIASGEMGPSSAVNNRRGLIYQTRP